MKTRTWVGLALLCGAPLAMAGPKTAYPGDNVAQFVVDKLDATSLPSPFRPKKEKGKKTFADYGFQAQAVHQDDAVINSASDGKRISIKVLERNAEEIFVCLAEPNGDGKQAEALSVVKLKWNNHDALLKSSTTFREFAACPVPAEGEAPASNY